MPNNQFQAQDQGVVLQWTWYDENGNLVSFQPSATGFVEVKDPNSRKYTLNLLACAANSTTSYITGTQAHDFPVGGQYQVQPVVNTGNGTQQLSIDWQTLTVGPRL